MNATSVYQCGVPSLPIFPHAAQLYQRIGSPPTTPQLLLGWGQGRGAGVEAAAFYSRCNPRKLVNQGSCGGHCLDGALFWVP